MSKDLAVEKQRCKQLLESCTCMHIRRCSRSITQYFDALLAPVGVSSTQLTLLTTISLAQSQSLTKISETIEISQSSLTHMLRPMLEQNLVEFEIGANRKSKCLVLTERGKLILKLAIPLWEHAQEELVAKIGENEWQVLIEKLAVISQTPTVFVD